MKPFLLLLGVATFLGCQKFEASYHLNCQFERGFGPRWLVVTDYKGRVLGTEDLAPGKSTFNGDFTTHDSDSPDSFDVHLIYQDSFSHSYWVYSHLGVYNGSALFINPVEQSFQNDQEVYIHINGIESFNYLKLFESTSFNNYEFDAFQKQVKIYLVAEKGEGVVLRVKVSGEPFFRALYLQDTDLKPLDTLSVDWAAFVPETNTETVTFEKDLNPGIVGVEAVSPDFKHFVTLFYTNGNFSGTTVKFNRPASLPANWMYRISGYQNGLSFDRLYQQDDALFVEAYDDPLSGKLKDGQLKIEAKQPYDVMRVTGSATNPSDPLSHVYWLVTGRPSSLLEYSVPAFDQFLPDWADPQTVFKSGLIRAAKFDSYEYEQIQAGFPYQLNERFAYPKSGFKERWVNY